MRDEKKTTHHSLLITHYSSLITHHSLLITHYFTHYSLLITDFDSSRWSQARARLQSRLTVASETFNTSAASSFVNPPKNRNSTTRLWRASSSASALSASSSATMSVPLESTTKAASSNVTGRVPPPRFS